MSSLSRIVTPAGYPAWHVTDYPSVKTLLADKRLGKTHPKPSVAPWYTRSGMAGGPRGSGGNEHELHGHRRRLMNRAFPRAQQAALAPWITEVAGELAAAFARLPPPVNVHTSYSAPLARIVLARLLGIPAQDVDAFYGEPDRDSIAGLARRVGYVRRLLASGNCEESGAVARLLGAEEFSVQQDGAWAARLLSGMFIFGCEAPAAALDWTMSMLLLQPGHGDLVRSDRQVLSSAVEEALRLFNPPAATDDGLIRYASDGLCVAGETVDVGEMVLLDIAAANRDPCVFAEPERFDVALHSHEHLSFGHGPYMCNFAELARAEIMAGIWCLLREIPQLRLATQARSMPGGSRAQAFLAPVVEW
ncbi:MAG TPA: cytochrome P450 [Jatrophihabitans sp.]|nr:cytochrome P450 [Jatrophihabitans sp.]